MVRPRLLAIFAHPDDESFGTGGTLARYAREDVEVHVCTVTDGAAGTVDADEKLRDENEQLAEIRRQELECACQVLGAQLHTLDYRDSGMVGGTDNSHPDSLFQADLGAVANALTCIILQVRPHVVITHDPSGGYFHPDHIRVSQAVIHAWDGLGNNSVDPQPGPQVWQPERLYYTVFPRSTVKWFVYILRLLRKDPSHFGQNKDIDLTKVGAPDDEISVRMDIGPHISVKEQASACHRSQGGGGASMIIPPFLRRRLMRYEHFVQARPPVVQRRQDLFEGLEMVD